MNTFDVHQTRRGVEFKWKDYGDGTSLFSVTFQDRQNPLDYSKLSMYFAMELPELSAHLRASYEDHRRKQIAERFNPHNAGFLERAEKADRLAREVERV